MRIFIIDQDLRSREILVERVDEALRRLKFKRAAVLDGSFDLILKHAGEDPPSVTFFGPGCYQELEEFVTRFRSFFPKAPLAAVLDNNVYAEEALELRRFLSARIMPIADIAQMAQFILDSGSSVGSDAGTAGQGVLAVLQGKGGVGASTLAASLAACWAHHERSVVLVDLDDTSPLITEWGKVGVAKRRAVGELLIRGEVPENRIREIVHQLPHYEDQLGIVGQPELYRESFQFKADVLEGAPSSAEFITALIRGLQETFDVVVVDAGRSWGVATFALLPLAQHLLFVSDDDRASLTRGFGNFQRFYRESDDPAEFDLAKWQFALNAATGESLTVEDLRREIESTEIFPAEVPVHVIPFSESGRDWLTTGEVPVTLYDIAECETRAAIEQIAYGLIPFPREEKKRRSAGGSLRAKFNRIMSIIS